MSRRELPHSAEQRLGPWHVLECEVEIERVVLDVCGESGVMQKRFRLGGEQESAPHLGVVQRLNAESISNQQQPAPSLIPKGVREHSFEHVHGSIAVLFVQVDQHFRVATAREAMATRLEPGA